MAAGNSVIGALRVDLGLNSAQFTTGLKQAESGLSRFSKAAGIGLAAVAAAATAAGVALGVAVKGAINHADALSKAAQKAGTSVEALSRLEYAAKLSDVSLESLTGSLGKLAKAMLEAGTNARSGPAAAFAALGVAVTDADGHLRATDAVFTDLADRFSRMEDGATKTALAMAVFGKGGGDLVPLLNSGANGLRDMAAEADRLGLTIDGKTGKAAEAFNDSLNKLGSVAQGFTNKVVKGSLPALQAFAETLSDPKVQQAAVDLGNVVIQAMSAITQTVGGAAKAVRDLWNAFTAPAGAGALGKGTASIEAQIAQWQKTLEWNKANGLTIGADRATNEIAALQKELASRAASATTSGGGPWRNGWGAGGLAMPAPSSDTGAASSPPPGVLNLPALGGAMKAAQEAIDPFQARMEELSPVLEKLHSPFETMKDDLTDLETMYKAGRITAEAYGSAVQRTYYNVAGAAFDMASGVTGALSQMFKDNKQLAVANAVVQGLSGVANALGSAPPPFNFINAAAVGAAAAANVANILSTSESTTSMPGSASSAPAAAAPSQGGAINLTIRGSGAVTTDDLVKQIADGIADGGYSHLLSVIKAN